MDPKFWGPGLWKYIHTTAANASTQQARNDFVNFIHALVPTIPCNACKKHFIEHSQKIDIRNYLKSAQHLFAWTWIMHDAVNHLQGKKWPERITHAEAVRAYFDIPSDKSIPHDIGLDSIACDEICAGHLAQMNIEDSESENQEIEEQKLENKKIVKKKFKSTKRR